MASKTLQDVVDRMWMNTMKYKCSNCGIEEEIEDDDERVIIANKGRLNENTTFTEIEVYCVKCKSNMLARP